MKCEARIIAVACVMLFAGLCHELGASHWVLGTVVAGAAVVAASLKTVEKKASVWMPDEDFPRWMLGELGAGRNPR